MQPGQTCHLDVSTLVFSSQDGRASLPDRLLFGIVSKTVLTVFLLLSGLRGLLGIFARSFNFVTNP